MAAQSYRVRIQGFDRVEFDEIEGLSGSIESVEFQDGDDLVMRKRPGRVRFGDITLRRGRLDAANFYHWWYAARAGKLERRRVTIDFLGERNRILLRWRMDAWPLSWEISARGRKGEMVALESITLAVENAEFSG